ncbi:hypothetical protein GCM10019016_137190 [Streptomyces prasinosporus]|uniref:Uncharacterized protein n=1 Tax=Streptomyces prasinosporus TaxID=68256 RepID=A0ABP6UI12_9ACTN
MRANRRSELLRSSGLERSRRTSRTHPRAAVSATSDDAGMTITMRGYGFTWTDPDGTPRASAVAYDAVSAGRRR